ncbi:MAG: hypothetical protein ABIJ15_01830 [bacterium]
MFFPFVRNFLFKSRIFIILPLLCGSLSAEDSFNYAKHLYDGGLHNEAAGELRRFIYFNPSDERIKDASILLVKALWKQEKHTEAQKAAKNLTGEDGHLLRGKLYFLDKNYDSARISAENALNKPECAVEAQNVIIASDLYKANWQGAIKSMSGFNRLNPKVENHFDKKSPVKLKSPAVAVTMSALLPGLGQAYSKHYSDALVTFLINGLFIGGSAAAWRNDYKVTSVLCGAMGVTYYMGNLYNAGLFVYQYNNYLKDTFAKEIREELGLKVWFSF